MNPLKRPLPERLEALEALANDAGLTGELEAKQRAKADALRAELAHELKSLPDRKRERSALTNEAERAAAAFAAAKAACYEAEKSMLETRGRLAVWTMADNGARERILTELERTAPPELCEALDDLSDADDLLRAAVRTDVFTAKNWLGARIGNVTTNMPEIKAAREKIAEAQRGVRALVHDGSISSGELVSRAWMLVDAALEPLFDFVSRQKWETRRSRPHGDLLAEVAGYGE
ncbi:hypothetical protein C5615_37570 [Burkholderia cepacia]|uniref:Uncharacterized protein n=1 Tax=Burkholderia cepacia TaxID=292 RepID=A0A2S8HYG2_BURCE|nr:hypothetical protein [Burkholderia cepacia]PQP07607.1 hypothetical protein C5615_37570 [Burkholderia cepacia]HDR9512059.1 hypothetical protein [Burkholderia cepacia]